MHLLFKLMIILSSLQILRNLNITIHCQRIIIPQMVLVEQNLQLLMVKNNGKNGLRILMIMVMMPLTQQMEDSHMHLLFKFKVISLQLLPNQTITIHCQRIIIPQMVLVEQNLQLLMVRNNGKNGLKILMIMVMLLKKLQIIEFHINLLLKNLKIKLLSNWKKKAGQQDQLQVHIHQHLKHQHITILLHQHIQLLMELQHGKLPNQEVKNNGNNGPKI